LKRKEETALQALLDPDLMAERTRLKAHYRETQAQRVRAEAELARIASAQQIVTPGAWLEETAALLQERIGSMTEMEQRQRFARQIVRKVEWDGAGQAAINCYFGGAMSNTLPRIGQFPSLELILTARLVA
jgi:hypothetical protein